MNSDSRGTEQRFSAYRTAVLGTGAPVPTGNYLGANCDSAGFPKKEIKMRSAISPSVLIVSGSFWYRSDRGNELYPPVTSAYLSDSDPI